MPSRHSGCIPHSTKSVTLALPLFLLLVSIASFSLPVFAAAPAWLQSMVDSCNQGSTQDCLNAGVAYKTGQFQGNKVAKDPAKAKIYINDGLQLAQKSCNQGNMQDCYTVGIMYFEGGVIPTDIPRGLNYLQRSCKGGYKQACDWLDNSGLRTMIR